MIVMAVDEYKKITHIMLGSDLWTDINMGSENLNIWYNELPPNLHLSTLGEADNSLSPQQVTAIYLMHTLFIDTQLLLYFRFIDSYLRTDTSQDSSTIDPIRIIYQMPESIFSTYTSFSIQLTRIICLLYDQENIFARCWIFM
ncbi:hypothetical protein N7488_005516 [Penicillium malachiteum]|nr:hypothetical protein N7488_005516 [Penicillium malachiteum]